MKKDNNKKIMTIVISIIIIIILVIAISYAFFRTELMGREGIVKVGELELVLNETSEGISLDNAIGLSDNDGMKLTPSTFELRNNGNKAVDYAIYLDDNQVSDSDTRIDDKYLKYNLNKNGSNSGATLLTTTGTNPNRVLDKGTIEGKGTNAYSLNLWITDEVDGNYSGQVFSGKLRVEVSQEKDKSVATVVTSNLGENGSTYDDGIDTFITGTNPNNYIWYSGKLWRAVSVANEAKTVKLVTQWNISAINYNTSGNTAFSGSHVEMWLNDTSIDGFLGNLRDPENFIVMDAKWDATMDNRSLGNITRPDGTTTITDAVGLLNMYEYQTSYTGTTYDLGYLNNSLRWWTLTAYDSSIIHYIYGDGSDGIELFGGYSYNTTGVRPSINLRKDAKIVSGDGTEDNPYRLEGDNDTNLSGTMLNTRYSGEYIRFGNNENNLYRIVSHENGTGTKITSAEPLKKGENFILSEYGTATNIYYSKDNILGKFLNNDYLDVSNRYLTSKDIEMIEDNTTWYLGTVGNEKSYRLAKYIDINMSNYAISTEAKVGLLRFGELMSGQFTSGENRTRTHYWTLTPADNSLIRVIVSSSSGYNYGALDKRGIKPALNLKSNVIITSGDGTKENPFKIELN